MFLHILSLILLISIYYTTNLIYNIFYLDLTSLILVSYLYMININIFLYLLFSIYGTLLLLISIYKSKMYYILGLIIKLNLWPFNTWLIELYERFTSKDLIIWSIYPKIVYVLIIMNYNWLIYNHILTFWLIFSILATSLLSYKYNSLKNLLAISSIINVSYLLLIYDKITYLIYYILHVLLIKEFINKNIFNLWNVNKTAYSIVLIYIMSNIGIPPLIGFKIKYLLLETLQFNPLLVISLIFSTIYYLYIWRYISTGRNIINLNIKNLGILTVLLVLL